MALTLKRLYATSATTGALHVSGVRILRAGAVGRRQHFTPNLLEQGVAQGWLSLSQGRLVIHGADGALVYRLDRPPGLYCAHCDQALADPGTAQDHVATLHPAAPSPDPSNPAGYAQRHYFACTRVE